MDIFIQHWERFLAFGTLAIGFIFGYNKKRTDSISDIQNVYRGLIKDVEHKVESMSRQMALNNERMEINNNKMLEMEVKINTLSQENQQMEAKISKLSLENVELKKQNTILSNLVNSLKQKK
jgi:chromosome segregation ATPase